ncbi:hypothetical protein C1N61_26800 (plasmid) [Priestia aryabhattai]
MLQSSCTSYFSIFIVEFSTSTNTAISPFIFNILECILIEKERRVKNLYFVLSDPHGCYQELKEILTHWKPQEQTLLLLGDIVDRGPSSLECLRLIMQLQEKGNMITVGGNHEQLLCE